MKHNFRSDILVPRFRVMSHLRGTVDNSRASDDFYDVCVQGWNSSLVLRIQTRIVVNDRIKRLKSKDPVHWRSHGIIADVHFEMVLTDFYYPPANRTRTVRLTRSGTHPINHFTIHRVFLGPATPTSRIHSPRSSTVFPRMKYENKLAPFCSRSYWFIFAPRCPTTYSTQNSITEFTKE